MRRLLWVAGFILLTFLGVTAVFLYHDWQAWATHYTGADDTAGPIYGYWSGFGSVFPWSLDTVVALWVIVWHHYKRMQCHEEKCWRIGTLPVGQYTVCKRHHHEATGDRLTIEHLRFHHKIATRKRLIDAGFKPGDMSDRSNRDSAESRTTGEHQAAD